MTFPYNPDALKETLASEEEIRRATVAHNAAERVKFFITDLEHLNEKDLRKQDVLTALIVTGTKIMELGLHTKGRLKATEGRSDAYLEATKANVQTAFRSANAILEECDVDLGAWTEALETAKPAVEDLTRISKGMDRPGVKMAVAPVVVEKAKPEPGPRLIEENGEPTPEAAQMEDPAPAPAPLQTLGFRAVEDVPPGEVIDAEVEDAHPLDGMDEGAAEEATQKLMEKLGEAGVEEAGLKRKDWAKAEKAWIAIWPEDCDLATTKKVYDLLTVALARNPISWDIPDEKEVIDHDRKLAIASGE